MKKYTWPCCGYETLDSQPPELYNICFICFWEDDELHFNDPDYQGGENHVSLRRVRITF